MKIAMIGSGAAGSVFACYLKKGGADLYLVDRYRAHMDAIAENGMTFTTPSGTELINGFHTAYTAQDLEIMDAVILMVKATQTETVMPSLSNIIGPETVIISLQNGLGNEEILKKYVPSDRILYGFGTIGTELPSPGHCVSKPESGIIIRYGAAVRSEKTDSFGKALENIFCRGGCEASFEKDIRPYVWKKAICNSGYNGVSTLTRLKVGDFLSCPEGISLIRTIWDEGCRVCFAATGYDLREEVESELPKLISGFATYYPSMAQDAVIHKRKTEIDHLNGALSRYGKQFGVPTPINDYITLLIHCMEHHYDLQYDK